MVERFRDELGDWRVCVHCALGMAVLAPWALAIERAARERYGMEIAATATNDGIVLRIPDTESDAPSAELIISTPTCSRRSSLTRSAARLCSRPGSGSAQPGPCCCLGETPRLGPAVAAADAIRPAADRGRPVSGFPDRAGDHAGVPDRRLRPRRAAGLQRQIASRSVRLIEVETAEPSPFAKSLLFGYVGAFVYEGDVPLAEKKAAALSLDASLLAELLGKDGLKQLLDAGVISAPRRTCRV